MAKQILIKTPLHSDEEEEEQKHLLMKTHGNLAICFNANLEYRKACIEFNEAMYDGGREARINAKLLFNHAKALCGLNEFDKAYREFMKVKKLNPQNSDVDRELKSLSLKQKKYQDDVRLMFGRMFPQEPTNTS